MDSRAVCRGGDAWMAGRLDRDQGSQFGEIEAALASGVRPRGGAREPAQG